MTSPSSDNKPDSIPINVISDGNRDDGSDNVEPDEEWVIPKDGDVLLGRGKSNHHHPGNKRFNALINDSRDEYFGSGSSVTKKQILNRIVDSISVHGRFLKRKEHGWVAVTQERALLKVAHAIQYHIRRSKESELDQTRLVAPQQQAATISSSGFGQPHSAATIPPGFVPPHPAVTIPTGFVQPHPAATIPPGFVQPQPAATIPPGFVQPQPPATISPASTMAPIYIMLKIERPMEFFSPNNFR